MPPIVGAGLYADRRPSKDITGSKSIKSARAVSYESFNDHC